MSLVVDAVLDTYREHVNSSLLFDQQRTVELSLKNVERLEAEVDERNQALREYVKTAPGIWNRMTENNPYQVRVESLESEMTALRTREVSLESRLTIMAQTHDALTGRVLSDLERLALIDQAHIGRLDMLVRVKEKHISIESQADYPQLQEFEKARFDKLLGLQSERAELRKNIGENHPDIIDIDAQINEIQKQLDTLRESVTDSSNISPQELVDSYIRMLEKELADTIIKIEFIKNEIETAVHQAQELTDFTIKAKHLEKQYDQSLEMYQAAANRSTKESMLSEFGNFVSEIVARPHHCELTWPKKPVILALCMILGIFAGSFISIALDLVAYSPLRRVFWFLPGWLLGGKSYEQVLNQADEAKRNSLQRSRTAESPEPANAPAALRSTEPPQSQPSPHSEGENGDE